VCYVRKVSRIGTLGKALILTIAAALLVGAPSALGGTPPSSRCAELLPGGTANTPDPVRAGPAAALPGSWSPGPRGLPDDVYLRNTTTTYNRLYEFTLAGGDLFARRRSTDERWRGVPLPDCLDGRLQGISADDDEMIGLDAERNVYTMDNALKNPALWNWTKRWGPVMWSGDGFALPANTMAWSWTVISPAEDGTWTDPAGNRYPVGEYKVSHIWGLRGGGRKLTFWDPWLPRDNSYEMCGPHHSRFRSVNLSTSGSHIFVIGKRGDMFTRLYDFDISGHDPIFFPYSYEDQRDKGDGSPIQLPAEPWTRQPKIDGTITSAISISKRGRDAVHATLRVEGRRKGHTGYWQRDLAAPRKQGWKFRRTDAPLEGEVLRNPGGNTSKRGLAPSEDMKFVMKGEGMRAVIPDFNTYCTPAHIEIHEDGRTRTVTFHHVDGLRQVERARGLDDDPRLQFGALEWPSGKIDQELQVFATTDAIEIPALGWTFERKP
jgi:hypothetical protein